MSSILRLASSRTNGAKSRGPVTAARRLASLANSAKSTGAVTPEGRAISSRNAVRHGILAESIVLDSESAERFTEVLSTLQDELQVKSPIETRRQEIADLSDLKNDETVEVNPARHTALAYRADKRKDQREARRAQRAKLRQNAAGGRSVLRDNTNNPKGECSDLHENEKSENAERSEPNIG